MAHRSRRSTGQAGLTLIEVLISMVVLAIVTTLLVVGWSNLQGASGVVIKSNNSRSTARDAMNRISNELRGSQPTSLPTPAPSSTATPTSQPPLTAAGPMEVRFYSSFNTAEANADGSGLTALRPTRVWLDTATVPPAPWNPDGRTLYLQRDVNNNGSFADAQDRSTVLARNVFNESVADATNGTAYTPVFRYAYRDMGGSIQWTDNAGSGLDLASVVALRVRLIIDTNLDRSPKYVDTSTTVRLRNASAN